MVILVVHLHVKPEKLDSFLEVTLENARNSVQEPGVVRFDVLQQSDDPTRFVFYEVYRDTDAPARHRDTPHYQKWFSLVPDMLTEARTRTLYSNVFPADQAW